MSRRKRPVRHHLVFIDRDARDTELQGRPVRHVHKWQGVCSCGNWSSIPRRTHTRVRDDHKLHLTTRIDRQINVRRYAGPRQLTPHADLPEELR